MEKKSKKRGTSKAASQGAAFEKDLGPLVKAIDKAVAGIADEKERSHVRTAVGEAVHGAIRQLAARPMAAGGMSSLAVGDALNAGVDALKQVQELGFVEFTTGLINGTFDAIINATIKQMNAYADLVADLAKTLSQFKAENVDEGKITAHLAGRYSDGAGGTSVRPDFEFEDTAADPDNGIEEKTAHTKLLEVANALISETSTNATPLQFTGDDAIEEDQTQFTATQVNKARRAIGERLAISMIEHLRAMAREGMARIVISNGEILSKLTFKVATSEIDTVQKNRLDQSSLGVGVKGRFGGKSWGVQFGVNYNQLRVSTVNESSFDSVTMNAEIVGQVKINFRTETFPPIVTDTPIA